MIFALFTAMLQKVRAYLLVDEFANIAFYANIPIEESKNGRLALYADDMGLLKVLKRGMSCRIQISNQADITAKITDYQVQSSKDGLVLECSA